MYTNGVALTVTKFLVVESGVYGDQYRRPYETVLSGDIQSIVAQRYQNVKGEVSTGSVLAGVAGSFLMPQKQPEAPIAIPGGWGQVRYRALLEIEATAQNGYTTREVVMAWSDMVDASLSGHINPDLVFYINTVNVLRDWQQETPNGQVNMSAVANSSHLVSHDMFEGHGGPRQNSVRPMDVFSFISQKSIDPETAQSDIYDGRTTLTKTPVKSQRRNTVAAAYANQVLNAFNISHATGQATGGTGFDQIAEAQGLVMESEAQQDFFLRALRDHRGAPMIEKHFSLREVQALSPHTLPDFIMRHDSVLHVVKTTPPMLADRYAGLEAADWGKTNPLTSVATVLAHEVPSLLMENMFTRAVIKASNRVYVDNRISVVMSNYESFSNMDLTQHMRVVESRLAHETMMAISNNNTLDFDIEMLIRLDGDSRFTISMQGGTPVEFICPSFADALLAPVITKEKQRAFDIANDFQALGEIISDAGSQVPLMSGAVFMANTNRSF